MALSLFKTADQSMTLMQTSWKTAIDPVLANPLMQGVYLSNVALMNGTTIINHLLSRTQQGWIIVDVNGAATIYRSMPFNDQTLVLTSNASVTVNLYVY